MLRRSAKASTSWSRRRSRKLVISLFSGGRSASQEPREYKVRIEHKSGAGGAGGKKRKNELSLDWIFTCSCKPELRHWSFSGDGQPAVYPICKHIGACLIVHFH